MSDDTSFDTVRETPDFEPPQETIPVRDVDGATRYRDVIVEPQQRPPRFNGSYLGDIFRHPGTHLRHPDDIRTAVQTWAIEAWKDTVRPLVRRVRTAVDPVLRFALAAVKTITGLGWTALGLGTAAWIVGGLFGWSEAGVVACLCLTMVVIGALFTIGRTSVEVDLSLAPMRVVVGQSALASFDITNSSSRRQSSVRVRLPIGEAAAHFSAPALAPGESFEDWVSIPTDQRGVVNVGPLITYREDPLGLVRREVSWTDRYQLYIHPAIAALDELGTGLLRDLEGRSTQDMSNSDLAFHTLRDYIPGDDQRYIHWKSSARLSSVSGEDEFMVRQFLDTRKTHVALISDLATTHFTSDEEFELAMSCAASIAARTVMDGMDLTVLCGDQVVVRPTSNYALDPYSWAERSERSLMGEFERVRARAADASMAVIVTGSPTPLDELLRGRAVLPYAIPMVVIRVALRRKIALKDMGTFIELTVGRLDDLPKALRGGLV